MADIKQAAKWLEEGKTVEQVERPDSMPLHIQKKRKAPWFGYIVDCNGDWVPLKTNQLLGNDWEIR